jgi:hypothetical protein
LVVSQHAGLAGGEFEQTADGGAGSTTGMGFQDLSKEDERQDYGCSFEIERDIPPVS